MQTRGGIFRSSGAHPSDGGPSRPSRSGLAVLGLAVASASACKEQTASPGPTGSSDVSNVNMRPPAPSSAAPFGSAAAPAASVRAEAPACPSDMTPIAGGEFWVGSPRGTFSEDESPRHKTSLAAFCLDLTEVTVDAYAVCVAQRACTPTRSSPMRRSCNALRTDRGDHPINCVDWRQAEAYCRFRERRLPTEAEWEYAARAGERYFEYPWGNETPDGRACWKKPSTCPVKSFPPGAFGVYDLSGNVWEWTSSGYGDYPWPVLAPELRVYRGGSFSRRFEKWMHTRLRNRWGERDAGSHLGFRCALKAPGAKCAFGEGEAGACVYGVLEAECEAGKAWNGVRCAAPGAARCSPGATEQKGFGCVRAAGSSAGAAAAASERAARELKNVERVRAPEFDQDCKTYQPSRPRAYRYQGGTHAARNVLGAQSGCKNRDVGVGWNSACCP